MFSHLYICIIAYLSIVTTSVDRSDWSVTFLFALSNTHSFCAGIIAQCTGVLLTALGHSVCGRVEVHTHCVGSVMSPHCCRGCERIWEFM